MQLMFTKKIMNIGYDTDNGILEVEFNGGISRKYFDVPQKVYDDLCNVADKNKYIFNNIDGHYRIGSSR